MTWMGRMGPVPSLLSCLIRSPSAPRSSSTLPRIGLDSPFFHSIFSFVVYRHGDGVSLYTLDFLVDYRASRHVKMIL